MASRFEHMKVRLSSLIDADDPVIRDVTFFDCTILGPAVIAPTGSGQITHSSFDSEPNGLFWTTADVWPLKPSGVIIALNCTFDYCKFVGVGIAAPREHLDKMKTGFAPAPANAQGGMDVRPPNYKV